MGPESNGPSIQLVPTLVARTTRFILTRGLLTSWIIRFNLGFSSSSRYLSLPIVTKFNRTFTIITSCVYDARFLKKLNLKGYIGARKESINNTTMGDYGCNRKNSHLLSARLFTINVILKNFNALKTLLIPTNLSRRRQLLTGVLHTPQ